MGLIEMRSEWEERCLWIHRMAWSIWTRRIEYTNTQTVNLLVWKHLEEGGYRFRHGIWGIKNGETNRENKSGMTDGEVVYQEAIYEYLGSFISLHFTTKWAWMCTGKGCIEDTYANQRLNITSIQYLHTSYMPVLQIVSNPSFCPHCSVKSLIISLGSCEL